jgi:hypothetical protein
MTKPDRPGIKRTPFGKYLKFNNIPMDSAAKALGVTRQYAQALATGYMTPGMRLAWDIERWTKGRVAMQSWMPQYRTTRRPK